MLTLSFTKGFPGGGVLELASTLLIGLATVAGIAGEAQLSLKPTNVQAASW